MDVYKPNSVPQHLYKCWGIVIYLGLRSLANSSGTHQSCPSGKIGARPCIQVRILLFQPDLTGSFLFSPLWLPTTGVTCYPFVRLHMCDTSQKMFGLSSPTTFKVMEATTQHPSLLCHKNPLFANLLGT